MGISEEDRILMENLYGMCYY